MPTTPSSYLSVLWLIVIAGLTVQSNSFSTIKHRNRRDHPDTSNRQLSSMVLAATQGNNEIRDPTGMKQAFDSFNRLSPDDVAPPWKNKPKTPLKYNRSDDTQLFYRGKSTEDEVEYYLEMQRELEGDDSPTNNDETSNEPDDVLSDLLHEKYNDDGLTSDLDRKHPWNSINPILRLRGPVATGYGRGGKKLGVPTANLPSSLFQSALENIDAGVYFGWAVIEGIDGKVKNVPIKAVVNVGYSPTFEGEENKEKIVEAHLLTKTSPGIKYEGIADVNADDGEDYSTNSEEIEIDEDFYGETMRLQLIGFLRPEQKFDAFPDLIAQIHRDIGHAGAALDAFPYIFSKEDEFISNCSDGVWIGSGGGDDTASWEYETW